METLWKTLENDDAHKAFAAINTLIARPQESVPFVQSRMTAARGTVDSKKIQKWIADLDDEDFTTRKTAELELIKLGRLVEQARAGDAGEDKIGGDASPVERDLESAGEERFADPCHSGNAGTGGAGECEHARSTAAAGEASHHTATAEAELTMEAKAALGAGRNEPRNRRH